MATHTSGTQDRILDKAGAAECIITDLLEIIDDLDSKIEEREDRIKDLQAEIDGLQDQIRDLVREGK